MNVREGIISMEFYRSIVNFTPGFFGSITAGIFIAIVLGQKPLKLNIGSIAWFQLIGIGVLLYILGVLLTWNILRKLK